MYGDLMVSGGRNGRTTRIVAADAADHAISENAVERLGQTMCPQRTRMSRACS